MNRAALIRFSRAWAMPNSDTFDVKPIGEFVQKYLGLSKISVDPFARNKRWATYTNDLNPATKAEHHLDAGDFLVMLKAEGVQCDLAIMDPPYSPRQISECYQEAGIKRGMKDTQNAGLYSRVRTALEAVLTPDAVVLSFGWNSSGMGKKHGFTIIETMLVNHGAAHNDTICLAEKRGAVAVKSHSGKSVDVPENVRWYVDYCQKERSFKVSPLAVILSLAVRDRSPNDSNHEWKADNAMLIQYALNNNG